MLSYFGIDAYCETVEYVVHRTDKKEEGTTIRNKGARFEPATQDLINQAQPGDYYYFDDVKARCPGDKVARKLGSLTFKIK